MKHSHPTGAAPAAHRPDFYTRLVAEWRDFNRLQLQQDGGLPEADRLRAEQRSTIAGWLLERAVRPDELELLLGVLNPELGRRMRGEFALLSMAYDLSRGGAR